MTRRTSNIIGATAAFILVAGFCGGILGAFYTDDWRWLALSLVCWIILGAG